MTVLTAFLWIVGVPVVIAVVAFTLIMAYVFYAGLMYKGTINRRELARGSVLDPYNHPSYTAEKVSMLKDVADQRDAAINKANEDFDKIARSL